jgi:hypothetical protein
MDLLFRNKREGGSTAAVGPPEEVKAHPIYNHQARTTSLWLNSMMKIICPEYHPVAVKDCGHQSTTRKILSFK